MFLTCPVWQVKLKATGDEKNIYTVVANSLTPFFHLVPYSNYNFCTLYETKVKMLFEDWPYLPHLKFSFVWKWFCTMLAIQPLLWNDGVMMIIRVFVKFGFDGKCFWKYNSSLTIYLKINQVFFSIFKSSWSCVHWGPAIRTTDTTVLRKYGKWISTIVSQYG